MKYIDKSVRRALVKTVNLCDVADMPQKDVCVASVLAIVLRFVCEVPLLQFEDIFFAC